MIATDLVTFAGSVGGLASAAQALSTALTGPAKNSWWGSLRQASFGGVPFAVLSARTSFGNRNAVHEYPYRDDVWVEPMGKLPRRFEIQGFLVENSLVYGGGPVIGQRDRLIDACEAGGLQTLVHPTFGTIQNVNCLASETSEAIDNGRVILVRLLFIRGGTRIYPNVSTSPAGAVDSAAANATTSALQDFAANVANAVQEGAAVVHTAVDTAVGWYQIVQTDINDVRRVFNAVSTLGGNFSRFFGGGNSGVTGTNATAPAGTTAQQLLDQDTVNVAAVEQAGTALQTAAGTVGDTATFGAATQQLVTAFAATAEDPADAIRLLTDLSSFAPSTTFTSSNIGTAMQTMQTECAALFRRTAIAAVGQAVAAYQPSSLDDAASQMSAFATLIDGEIEAAGDAEDDASFTALSALRNAVIGNLSQRSSGLASLEEFSFNAALPALVLSHRIYDDATRADQLVQQVQPIHPLFMPLLFDALSS